MCYFYFVINENTKGPLGSLLGNINRKNRDYLLEDFLPNLPVRTKRSNFYCFSTKSLSQSQAPQATLLDTDHRRLPEEERKSCQV